MSQEVDELFGEGGGTPSPRWGLALGLMVSGVGLAVLGLPCTAVPGGVLALLGWFVVEQDADRLEAGYLPQDSRRTVRSLRTVGILVVATIAALVMLQTWLASATPIYDELWSPVLQWISEWRGPPPDPPAAPTP